MPIMDVELNRIWLFPKRLRDHALGQCRVPRSCGCLLWPEGLRRYGARWTSAHWTTRWSVARPRAIADGNNCAYDARVSFTLTDWRRGHDKYAAALS